MNEINHGQSMWSALEYYHQHARMYKAKIEVLEFDVEYVKRMLGLEDDKLSPKKEVMKHTMD